LRAEHPGESRLARATAVAATVVGAGLGALAAGWPGAAAGVVVGAALGLLLWRRARARERARRRVLASPFPEPWRRTLLEWCDSYERLDPAWRMRFEDDVRLFLHEKRVTGVRLELTDELRLLVAASAVTLSVGWPEFEWTGLGEVLVYPDDFDRDYAFQDGERTSESHAWDEGPLERAGEAHPWGTVILSAPSLRESFEYSDDAYHVGFHEFAHLLDVDQTRFDGIPAGMSDAAARRWTSVAAREMESLRRAEGSRRARPVFDDYGAHEPAEFFGVAVEAFFEVPQLVRRKHPEVYELLSRYFAQDPAAWDDARGLEE
jgi:Mlc titration factor MtfA (ptsG expression regulator)